MKTKFGKALVKQITKQQQEISRRQKAILEEIQDANPSDNWTQHALEQSMELSDEWERLSKKLNHMVLMEQIHGGRSK